MSYLNQLKKHKETLDINLKQFDNDIQHAQRSIELLEQQKKAIDEQLCLINESIADEERKPND